MGKLTAAAEQMLSGGTEPVTRHEGEPSQGGSTIGRCISALEAIAQSDVPLTLAEVTMRLDMPKASVHRLLTQLEEAGLIRRHFGGKRFVVADRSVSLGFAAIRAASATATQPILKALVSDIGETCNLGVLDGTEVVYIDRVECDWPLRASFAAGSRVPVHCTATGKLFLALAPARAGEILRRGLVLARHAPATRTDSRALEAELARIRLAGHAENDQEYMEGVIGLAVPVFGPRRRMVAGLAVHAPASRLSLEGARRHLPALRAAAASLSALVA